MYYTPSTESTDSEDTSEDSTEDTSSTSTELYDMKIVTSDGNTYEIYSIDLGDMEKASLTMDDRFRNSVSSLYESVRKERKRYKR